MTVRAARISHACAGRWGPLPARPREIRAETCVNARPSRRSSRGTPRARGTRTRRSRSRGSRTTQRRDITARYARKETAASPKILPPRARSRVTRNAPKGDRRSRSRPTRVFDTFTSHATKKKEKRKTKLLDARRRDSPRQDEVTKTRADLVAAHRLVREPASSRARGTCDGAHDAHDDDPQPR